MPLDAGIIVRCEGLPGGSLVPLFPSKIALCSRTFSVFVPFVMNLLTMFSSSNL